MERPARAISPPRQNLDPPTDECRMATLGDRFLAFVLDSMVLFGLFAITDAWAFMRWGTVEGWELRLPAASILVAGFFNAVIFFLYLWLLEASFGATLGKAMVGIRVVRTTDRNPFSALAIRNLLRIIDGLGFYLVGAVVAACSPLHRRVGDMCAGTAVIEEEFGAWTKLASVLLWIAILSAAIWQVPRLCAAGNVSRSPRYLGQTVVQVGRTENSAYFKIVRLKIDVQLASATPR